MHAREVCYGKELFCPIWRTFNVRLRKENEGYKDETCAFGLVVKMLVGMPGSPISMPDGSLDSTPNSSFLVNTLN